MQPDIPPWKQDGKPCPPEIMRKCEPERYELQLFQFGDPESIAQYTETRTVHDACRVALRTGEQCIKDTNG